MDAAYNRFAPIIIANGRRFVELADAREVAAEILVKLFAPARSHQREFKNVAAYLNRATRNACLRKLEQTSRREDAHDAYAAQIFSGPDVEFSAEGGLTSEVAQRRYRRLYAAIDQLSDSQRECLTLFYFADYSYRDIARITERTEVQVKSAIQNGRIRLFNLLNHRQL